MFSHVKGVMQQYLGLRTFTQLSSLHKLRVKQRAYTSVLISWLEKQKRVSIQTGPPLTLFLHSDTPVVSHSIG